jgi:hypothetical protein
MYLSREYIKKLYETLNGIKHSNRYFMYLVVKNKALIEPEYKGISEYIKTQVKGIDEYEEKRTLLINKYSEKDDNGKVSISGYGNIKIQKNNFFEFNIKSNELLLEYYDIINLRKEEMETNLLFLREDIDININNIDLNKLPIDLEQYVVNNIVNMINGSNNSMFLECKRYRILDIINVLNNINYINSDNIFKYQIASNISIFSKELEYYNDIKNEYSKENIHLNIDRDKIKNEYAEKDMNGDLIIEGNNIKINNKLLNKYNKDMSDLDIKYGDFIKSEQNKIDKYLNEQISITPFIIENDHIPVDLDQKKYEILFDIIK